MDPSVFAAAGFCGSTVRRAWHIGGGCPGCCRPFAGPPPSGSLQAPGTEHAGRRQQRHEHRYSPLPNRHCRMSQLPRRSVGSLRRLGLSQTHAEVAADFGVDAW